MTMNYTIHVTSFDENIVTTEVTEDNVPARGVLTDVLEDKRALIFTDTDGEVWAIANVVRVRITPIKEG
jgi:hypothetical protein